MHRNAVILIAENNQTHFELITRNLQRAGVTNKIHHFTDGQQTLDFIFKNADGPAQQQNKEYLLLLNTDIPQVDGTEVLQKIKQDNELKKMPVIVLTQTKEQPTIELCNNLGCSICIAKPIENEDLAETVRKIGQFLTVIELPQINANGYSQGIA